MAYVLCDSTIQAILNQTLVAGQADPTNVILTLTQMQSIPETVEILVSTMHCRSQQTSTLSGEPAIAWKKYPGILT